MIYASLLCDRPPLPCLIHNNQCIGEGCLMGATLGRTMIDEIRLACRLGSSTCDCEQEPELTIRAHEPLTSDECQVG
jgi:hypothetical protein